MAGLRGSLARILPDIGWRKIMDLSDRLPRRSAATIGQLRDQEIAKFRNLCSGLEWAAINESGVIYSTPSESAQLRNLFHHSDATVHALNRSAISANVLRGWVIVSRDLAGRRRDLAEAVGIRILEVGSKSEPLEPNALDFPGPVDLVYTWVDAADSEWRKNRNRAVREQDEEALPTASDEARYTSNDELKYSLRSVESFLPWVNHIYLVTAGQVPTWLNVDHPKMTLVSHEDIFSAVSDLPTFNSHAIESQIHHIPSLAEHFVYVNDDVFFGRELRPETFFTAAGLARYQVSDRLFLTDAINGLPVNVAAQNNADLLRRRFGAIATLKFKHVAHALRKSVLEQIEAENSDAVAMTASARFRSHTDLSVPSSLAHHYGALLGKAVPGCATYKYIDLGSAQAQVELAKTFWSDRQQMMCLNQVSGPISDLGRQMKMAVHFLEKMYPWQSSFERDN
ncbi:stealth conserved region 3 domain-containing protein [Paeniglutamicibacter gangotriensis]|uniref:Capsular polysaccharide phosphotransferase SacB n=1 Tax=Paeniglutamicibacter gangotriensis Lz1y TaxID=1276920 RepID=M7MYF4_9MICC|nr:stealth conserved region 3 domain-containing protein [Paeniglutamicibacter gangotriensis]EMQ99975.1 Capsular polysaccharide phosphotransferase SacB [Paeniglutamicibacter gangotriensis Lz1y]